MKKWERVARSFIDSCSFKDDIEAVFLTGSHVFGNADEFSDIDLYIILSDSVDWRERGNKRVDGMLIEYFANPMRQVKKYIDDSYANVRLIEINMILGGNIIFDKNSAADKAIAYCKEKLSEDFPEMSEFSIKTGLYLLWDCLDELKRSHSMDSSDFTMQYFRFVQSAFELYSRYVCSPVPNYHKLYRWLNDEEYFNRYGLVAHKDPEFVALVRSAFTCEDNATMFGMAEGLYEYVAGKMGGMDIGNFVLRGGCEI